MSFFFAVVADEVDTTMVTSYSFLQSEQDISNFKKSNEIDPMRLVWKETRVVKSFVGFWSFFSLWIGSIVAIYQRQKGGIIMEISSSSKLCVSLSLNVVYGFFFTLLREFEWMRVLALFAAYLFRYFSVWWRELAIFTVVIKFEFRDWNDAFYVNFLSNFADQRYLTDPVIYSLIIPIFLCKQFRLFCVSHW